MIDMHCHILPGVDDGPDHLEAAVQLALNAASEGVTDVIATPHYRRGLYETSAARIKLETQVLNAELRSRGISLVVHSGQEIRVCDNLLEDLEAGKLLPLGNTSYVLLELPFSRIPERFEDTLHEMRVAGWTPVIAHPERNAIIAANPDELARFAEYGAAAQVTSHSLTGRFGNATKAAAIELCRRHLIHMIASDAHNDTSRPYELRTAFDVVAGKLGVELAACFVRNANAVLGGALLERGEPAPKRGSFARLMARIAQPFQYERRRDTFH